MAADLRRVETDELDIAYEVAGEGVPVLLLHGFPYDVRCYDGVVDRLAGRGFQTFTPYLRGFGPTRFRDRQAHRAGEQAAIAKDALAFVEALGIDRPIVVGFDWGGRAAGSVSALWPERFGGTVLCGGYTIYDVAGAGKPGPAWLEREMWYQYYFATERGRQGLTTNRRDICALLWKSWSPEWPFDEGVYATSAASFDNPDFVEVSLHSYRHRLGFAPGDPRHAEVAARLAQRPAVTIPAITLHAGSGIFPPTAGEDSGIFPRLVATRIVEGAGHNVPHEAPGAVADAVIELAPHR